MKSKQVSTNPNHFAPKLTDFEFTKLIFMYEMNVENFGY